MTYPQNHKVIDLSHWNSNPTFGMVKGAGVLGVIHKFSQGADMKDAMYAGRRTAAKATGLLWGRYQFGTTADVESQVAWFLDGWQPDELLALDWEKNEANPADTMTLDQAVEFHDLVFQATGRHIVLYGGGAIKDALKGKPNAALSQCRLWLAQYASAPVCPPGWDKPWLWQWTSHGSVAGIVGNVDLDAFDGTDDELRNAWAGVSVLAEPPAVLVETPILDTVTVTITVPRGAKVSIKTTGNVET